MHRFDFLQLDDSNILVNDVLAKRLLGCVVVEALTNLFAVRSAPLTDIRPLFTFFPMIVLGRDESRDLLLNRLFVAGRESFLLPRMF